MEKYNLKTIIGKLKGDVGEVIFTNLRRYAHRARFDSHYWFDTFKFKIPEKMKSFLRNNWGTIDAFEFVIENEIITNVIFYEIKTSQNKYKKQSLTENSCKFYEECQNRGYIVKYILVYFASNWDFEIIEKNFKKIDFRINNGGPSIWKRRSVS